MPTWIAIALSVVVGFALLVLWTKHQARVQLLSLPMFPTVYAEVEAASVPASIDAALASVFVELEPIGFQPAGVMASPLFPGTPPRFLGVFRNAEARAWATVGFSLGTMKGATVDFQTFFDDGTWLTTLNRRGHFSRETFSQGRILDAAAASIAEQWRAHAAAVAQDPTRAPRDVDLAEVAHHHNATEAEERELGIADGTRRRAEDGTSVRFTPLGVTRFAEAVQSGMQRIAKLPPLTGALAMPIPVDELERKFQDLTYLAAQRPKPRRGLAFLLSAVAFAVSAVFVDQWSWLLWVIPFLLLHELGHFGAMRLFGHSDARIRFIPFFGAATMTTTQFRKLSHEMVVLLAGPLPGIIVGFALIQLADFGTSRYLTSIGITLFTINSLNLLPVYPLDGGRIVHALLTAGRPRLDLVLKGAAAAIFLVAAFAYKDATLVFVGVGGFLFLRSGARDLRLEKNIRLQPGFTPSLSPVQRRRFVFEALAGQEGTDGNVWVQKVRALEVSLGRTPPRFAAALPWLTLYGAFLGAIVAWSWSIFAVTPKVTARCPDRAEAKQINCASAVDDVDWDHPASGTITRNPFKLATRAEFPFAAFVWFTDVKSNSGPLVLKLQEAGAAWGLCPALPWEPMPPETATQRENARWTLRVATSGGFSLSRAQRLRHLEQLPNQIQRSPRFDAETVRLYRETLNDGPEASAAEDRLSERIGRSPTESCKRLQLFRVRVEADDEGEDAGDAPAGEAAPKWSTRLSVMMASPAELAPLRRMLCDVAGTVSVLPYGSLDARLKGCY